MSDCILYSNNTVSPDEDQNWIYKVNDYGSRFQKIFTSQRNFESNDETDFVFQLDHDMKFSYQFVRDSKM